MTLPTTSFGFGFAKNLMDAVQLIVFANHNDEIVILSLDDFTPVKSLPNQFDFKEAVKASPLAAQLCMASGPSENWIVCTSSYTRLAVCCIMIISSHCNEQLSLAQ